MTNYYYRLIIPFVVLSLVTEPGSRAQELTREQQVDQIFEPWNKPDVPGASVAIVQDGKIIFKKGYGSANLEYGIPNTPSTVFHIASVSKQFTAFAVLLLEEDGKLSLDDDVRKYIPELHDFGKTITLRHLALHCSGLRDQWQLLAMAGWRLDDVIRQEQILKLLFRQGELNFNPGDLHLYSNSGFTILAEVVARVSGMPFAEFAKERIFKPLKMNNTLFYDDHEKIVNNRAYSYRNDGSGYKKSVLNYANVGATSLFTTVEDLSLWVMNFHDPVVGNKETFGKFQQRGILNNGDTINYSLGLSFNIYKGIRGIGHGGSDAGYRSFLTMFPQQNFAVIVLSNLGSFDPAGMALKITDIYLEDHLIAETPAAPPGPEGTPQFTGNAGVLKTYCGEYVLNPQFIINITQEGDKLFAEAPQLPHTQLTQTSDAGFTVPGVNAQVTFTADSDGEINQLIVILNGQRMTASRKGSENAVIPYLPDYAGEYYSPELGATYVFTLKEGKLIASHIRHNDFELTPLARDHFSSSQWFFNRVDFTRNSEDQVSGCLVSGGRVRGVKFIKVTGDE